LERFFAETKVSAVSAVDCLFKGYLDEILNQLKERLGQTLVSVVLYGSVARGEAGEGSDIDLLVVSGSFGRSFGSRFELFNEVENSLLSSESRRRLRQLKRGTLISPVPLTPEEVKRNPPILLDIIVDGIILYDKDGFLKDRLEELEKKLQSLGARRIRLPSGSWYWDLKPDYQFGEVVEI